MSTQDALHVPAHAAVVPAAPATNLDALPPGVPLERLYRFTVEEYHDMGKKGILPRRAPVELIEGLIITMSPIGLHHKFAVNKLISILVPLVEPDWHVSPQSPMALPNSEPQTDIAIVRGVPEDYLERHATPGDVALLIEVADSSLEYDRHTKGFLYFRHAVPEYWIINVIDRVLEIYRREIGRQEFTLAEVLDRSKSLPLILDGKTRGQLRVSDLIAPGSG
jgi:Uma2 family endonuclease